MSIQTIKSTLVHRIISPQNKSGVKSPCLIMLHGRGADEHDLLGLAQYLDQRLFIISVRAPLPFDFGLGYTWYEFQQNYDPDIESITESLNKLSTFLNDAIKKYPIDPKKIFILGFSMGTVMGNLMLLKHPDKIAGHIANSGYLPNNSGFKYNWENIRHTPIFVAHGTHDTIIPLELGKRMRDAFINAEADVTYNEYTMGHEISIESMNDFSNWLTLKLNSIK